MRSAIVIPLHHKGGKFGTDLELRYALRSIAKHFQGEYDIHLIGSRVPGWVRNVQHIHDNKGLKSALLEAARLFPEGFHWMYDDLVLLQDVDAGTMRITPARPVCGALQMEAAAKMGMEMPECDGKCKGCGPSESTWGRRLREMYWEVAKAGRPIHDYSRPHGPYWFTAEMVHGAFKALPGVGGKTPIETYMLCMADHPRCYHVSAQYYGAFESPKEGKRYLNYNDEGNTEELRAWLAARFPEPCEHEMEAFPMDVVLRERALDPVPALMVYDTKNLGDYTQMRAVEALMPEAELEVNRETISKAKGGEKGKIVLAGWFMHTPRNWPPHPDLEPLFLSFHANKEELVARHVDYLRKHEPIGCRDMHTVRLCERHGVRAFFSGCVTLALPAPLDSARGEGRMLPMFVDAVAPQGMAHVRYGQMVSGRETLQQLRELSLQRDQQIAAAACVVTSRLHISTRCAAMGVPCLLISQGGPKDMERFEGLSQFVSFIPKWDDARIRAFVADPPANPNAGLREELADAMRRRIAAFYAGDDLPSAKAVPHAGSVAMGGKATPQKITKVITRKAAGGEWTRAWSSFPGTPADVRKVRGDIREFRPWDQNHYRKTVHESGVLALDGGATLDKQCWTVTADGELVIDMSFYPTEKELYLHGRQVPQVLYTTRYRGSCVDLGTNWASDNWAHWLLEAVGRISVLEAAGMRLEDFDHVRLPMKPKRPFRQAGKALELLGFDCGRLIAPQRGDTLMQFDRLVRPSMPGLSKQYHPQLAAWLREKIPVRPRNGFRKVFLRRTSKQRMMNNGAEVERMLIARGFHILDPADGELGDWAAAEVIVGAHQAGLADVVFAQPGAHLIELLMTDQQVQYYPTLTAQAGLNYHCVLCPSDHHRPVGTRNVSPYNFTTPVKVLSDLLDELGL